MLFLVSATKQSVDACGDLGSIIRVLKAVFVLLQWAIPIILVLFGAVDLGKAVIASKEDEMKKAQGTLIKRIVYALVIFFLFTIVSLVINLVGANKDANNNSTLITGYNWADCWRRS